MTDLLDVIRERHSSRAPFDAERRIDSVDMKRILEAARWAPTAHNMQNFEIVVVEDPEVLEAIAEVHHEVSETFIRESYAQLCFSEQELFEKKVGVLASMFPSAWWMPGERPAEERARAELFAAAIRSSAAVLVVLYDPRKRAPASEGDFLGVMSLGCVMENMWLVAESLGIGFHVLSAFRAGAAKNELLRLLAAPDHLEIAFACRLGYEVSSSRQPHVRRDLVTFVHKNRFGHHEP